MNLIKVSLYVDLIDEAWYALFDDLDNDTGIIAQWNFDEGIFIDEDKNEHLLQGYAVRQV